jgi:hypothetical protein
MKSRNLLLPVTYRLLTTTLLAVMLFGCCHDAPNHKSVPETINACSGAKAQTVFEKELDCSQTATTEAEFILDYASGTITSYSGPGGEVVIPAQINSVSVIHIGEGVFSGRDDISCVFIAEGVQTIGSSAFGDSSIESITIPKSINSIGDWAFWRTGITSMEIPEGVEVISVGLFMMCGGLSSFIIPQSAVSIGGVAFSLCNSLQEITIPSNVKTMGYGAFRHCENLASVVIEEGLESIEERAFEYCTSLNSIVIPASVTDVGNEVFASSTIKEIIFMGSRPTFTDTFEGASALEHIYYSKSAAGWPGEPVSIGVGWITPEAY